MATITPTRSTSAKTCTRLTGRACRRMTCCWRRPAAKGQQGQVIGTEPSAKTSNAFGEFAGRSPAAPRIETDTSAARFFYCAKASRRDRNEGLADPGPQFAHGSTLRDAENLSDRKGNHHPTVKPTDLMAYLCRLVTPPGGVVLDPFMGSGSTGKAAMREGFRFIGCELSAEYLAIADARIGQAWLAMQPPEPVAVSPTPQTDLFAGAAS